jgi:hypothetical protein
VKEEEAEYIVALTKSQWSEGGECEIVRETVAQERVVQELKPQLRTPEELFKEFEPYMQECFDWFDKHGGYGSQTPHDCWQVSWYGYWIDHKRAQEGKKDFEAYKMFDEVWVIYKDKMLRVEPKPERTVEELFKEFEPYMRKMHELQDSSSTAGNCQRWWKSRWYDFWIGHGHEHLRKDNEAFEMFSEVWTIYEETMTRWPERLRRMQREESVTKPAETVTKEPDIVNEPAQNVIDMAGAVAKKDMGKARSKKDNGFGEQLSLFG